ncbi:MAG: hypothetical protein HY721_24565 [Planctomycetes bacterium]|nr:hypothetical protein [Planctomycetota bacterium]
MASVTEWIEAAAQGDSAAQGHLFKRFWPRVVRELGAKLRRGVGRVQDAEDAVSVAFYEILEGLLQDPDSRPADRSEFLARLRDVALKRLVDQLRKEGALKRGGRKVVSGGLFVGSSSGSGGRPLEPAASAWLDPKVIAMAGEILQSFVAALDPTACDVLRLWIRGRRSPQIAAELCISEKKVQRRLRFIREVLEELEEGDSDG